MDNPIRPPTWEARAHARKHAFSRFSSTAAPPVRAAAHFFDAKRFCEVVSPLPCAWHARGVVVPLLRRSPRPCRKKPAWRVQYNSTRSFPAAAKSVSKIVQRRNFQNLHASSACPRRYFHAAFFGDWNGPRRAHVASSTTEGHRRQALRRNAPLCQSRNSADQFNLRA